MNEIKEILILCKVVDNFGDIGVVYRLAKAISDIKPQIKLTIACSCLESFAAMAPGIDTSLSTQSFNYKNSIWTVNDWDYAMNKAEVPQIILECFQCGRPDWLEEILFSKDNTTLYHILNIEYLTAEEYADDFHLLKSYTRSSYIKKMFFMPGFTAKTAGLVIDSQFARTIKPVEHIKNTLTVTLFSYERDFTEIFESLNRIQSDMQKQNPDFCVQVLAAAGKSLPFAKAAWENTGKKVQFKQLPFLKQEEWDEIMCNAHINFIRGEESLARAALCGRPFVWHAYIQDEDYQLVKVNALLDRLLPYLPAQNRSAVQQLWNQYNTPGQKLSAPDLDSLFNAVIQENLTAGFKDFSQALIKNGNLAENLLNHLQSLCIEKNA